MNPLLSLGTLSADVKHPVRQLTQVEHGLSYSRRPQPRSQKILVRGYVIVGPDTIEVVAEATINVRYVHEEICYLIRSLNSLIEVVVQRKLVALENRSLDTAVPPKHLDGVEEIFRQGVICIDLLIDEDMRKIFLYKYHC